MKWIVIGSCIIFCGLTAVATILTAPQSKQVTLSDPWSDGEPETMAKYANMLVPPKYQLIADGDSLSLRYSNKVFDIVEGRPNPVKVESLSYRDIVVTDREKEVGRLKDDAVMASIWSDKFQTLSFVTCRFDDDTEVIQGKNDRVRLWTYDRTNGLKMRLDLRGTMLAMDGSPREMRCSIDGDFVAFKFLETTKEYDYNKAEILMYSLSRHQVTRYRMPFDFYMDHSTVLDSHTLLLSGQQPEILDLKTGKTKPFPIPGLFPLVMFHGQPWTLHFEKGKYDIVRLNDLLDKFEQVVEIPERFPKPLRLPDYEDGGD